MSERLKPIYIRKETREKIVFLKKEKTYEQFLIEKLNLKEVATN